MTAVDRPPSAAHDSLLDRARVAWRAHDHAALAALPLPADLSDAERRVLALAAATGALETGELVRARELATEALTLDLDPALLARAWLASIDEDLAAAGAADADARRARAARWRDVVFARADVKTSVAPPTRLGKALGEATRYRNEVLRQRGLIESLRTSLHARPTADDSDAARPDDVSDAHQGGCALTAAPTAFNLADQRAADWLERAQVAVDLVSDMLVPGTRVADLGCGDRKLRDVLSAHVLAVYYAGYDLLPQSPEVVRFDLRSDRLPAPADIALLLGVTEYLPDITGALRLLRPQAGWLVASHVLASARSPSPARLAELGWISHLDRLEFLRALADAGFAPQRERMTPDGRTLVVAACRT